MVAYAANGGQWERLGESCGTVSRAESIDRCAIAIRMTVIIACHIGHSVVASGSVLREGCQSQNAARLAKVESRTAWVELRRVAIADVAEEIGFHMAGWQPFLCSCGTEEQEPRWFYICARGPHFRVS